MRIVISGGLGFIGSNFISKALKKNYKIYNIDRESYASNKHLLKIFNKNKNFTHKKLDIVNFKLLRSYVLKIKPDLIINFAAESHVDNTKTKQNKLIPGTNIPIVAPKKTKNYLGLYCILFSWNFEKEIIKKEKNRNIITKWIIPMPKIKII